MYKIPTIKTGKEIIKNTIISWYVLKNNVNIMLSAMKIIPPISGFFQASIVIPIKTKEGIKCINKAINTWGNANSANTSNANKLMNIINMIDKILGIQWIIFLEVFCFFIINKIKKEIYTISSSAITIKSPVAITALKGISTFPSLSFSRSSLSA